MAKDTTNFYIPDPNTGEELEKFSIANSEIKEFKQAFPEALEYLNYEVEGEGSFLLYNQIKIYF